MSPNYFEQDRRVSRRRFLEIAAGIKMLQVYRDTLSRKHAYQVVKLRDAGAPRDIGRYREMGRTPKDIVYEGGKIAPGAHLNEDTNPIGVHLFNRLLE